MSLLTAYFDSTLADRLSRTVASDGCLWVTDADGTLWRDDIGEGFLKRLIADDALVSPEARGVDVWRSYEDRVAQDKAAGYAWAAQVMAGLQEEEVNRRADDYARSFVPAALYPEMRALIAEARARGCLPWIVSASPRWIVAAAARVLELPVSQVLGMDVVVKDGRLTTEVVPPVMYKAGKAEAVARFIRRAPALVTGDSDGDVELLQLASALGVLMVHPGRTSAELESLARRHGWSTHSVSVGQ